MLSSLLCLVVKKGSRCVPDRLTESHNWSAIRVCTEDNSLACSEEMSCDTSYQLAAVITSMASEMSRRPALFAGRSSLIRGRLSAKVRRNMDPFLFRLHLHDEYMATPVMWCIGTLFMLGQVPAAACTVFYPDNRYNH